MEEDSNVNNHLVPQNSKPQMPILQMPTSPDQQLRRRHEREERLRILKGPQFMQIGLALDREPMFKPTYDVAVSHLSESSSQPTTSSQFDRQRPIPLELLFLAQVQRNCTYTTDEAGSDDPGPQIPPTNNPPRPRYILTCTLFILTYATVGAVSLALSLWWSIWKSDVSAGFTLGAYVLAVGTAITMPLQSRHNKRCRCQ